MFPLQPLKSPAAMQQFAVMLFNFAVMPLSNVEFHGKTLPAPFFQLL